MAFSRFWSSALSACEGDARSPSFLASSGTALWLFSPLLGLPTFVQPFACKSNVKYCHVSVGHPWSAPL